MTITAVFHAFWLPPDTLSSPAGGRGADDAGGDDGALPAAAGARSAAAVPGAAVGVAGRPQGPSVAAAQEREPAAARVRRRRGVVVGVQLSSA